MTERIRKRLERTYEKAQSIEQLPWHQSDPPRLLQNVVQRREKPGKTLDIGCGAGTYAIYLVQQGYAVTAVDFLEQAVHLTREQAAKAGVSIEVHRADILQWAGSGPFDLILDSGCLHGMNDTERRAYRVRLLEWLAADGDYVLVHFGRRHILDWRPTGPRRFTQGEIEKWFAPELIMQDHMSEVIKTPLPIGPTVKLGSYWFRWRNKKAGAGR
jgi:SAM-dependent methyltransferase